MPEDGTPPLDADLAWFEPLFRAHYGRLRAFAYRLLGSREAAEDAVQDTFLALWRARARWREAGPPPGAYLYRAVRNRVVDQLRAEGARARAEPAAVLAAIGPRPRDADTALLCADTLAAIDRAIGALPRPCREAFRLSRDHGLSYQEIARALAVSPRTVERLIGHALRALRSAVALLLVLGVGYGAAA